MNHKNAVAALAALAHEHRLGIYRLLVEAGPEGMNAGSIASHLRLPPSSLTFHLQNLHRAGLITQKRDSRLMIYAADFPAMTDLVGYLTENCCAGSSEDCSAECAPKPAAKKAGKTRKVA